MELIRPGSFSAIYGLALYIWTILVKVIERIYFLLVSTFPIVVILFHGCVSAMVLPSYYVSCYIYVIFITDVPSVVCLCDILTRYIFCCVGLASGKMTLR